MPIFLPEIVHDSSGSRVKGFSNILSLVSLSTIFSRKNLEVAFYPILLLLIHSLVFAFSFPRLDLPVADDANYFGYARLFARQGIALNADWTPILTYIGALFDTILPLGWYAQFALYSFLCRLTLLIGIYAFILRFTSCRRWAFLTTILSAICFSYWIQMNGRAFSNGALFLILAWIGPTRRLDILSALALTSMSFLLRPEHVLVCGGFCAYSMVLQYRAQSWKGIIIPSRGTVLLLALAIALWIPIFLKGNLQNHRLNFAFSQFFERYAIEEGLLEQAGLKWNSNWNEVRDTFFPPGNRKSPSPLSRMIPLYEIASSNPRLFGSFVWNNVQPFLTLEFELSKSPILSKLLNDYMVAIWLAFLIGFRKPINRLNLYPYLFFSSIFILSILPCLVTRPFRDYVFSAVIWFFCVIPFWVFRNASLRYWGIGIALLIAYSLQQSGWKEVIEENASMRNWKRAQFIDQTSHRIPLKNSIIAETYPIFCTAFNDEIKRSVHYELLWDDAGFLRSYGENGPIVDYVLLEALLPKHLLMKKRELLSWMSRWGEEIASQDGFSLWKVHQRIAAPNGSVIVTDDSVDEIDLSGSEDNDSLEEKEIVIQWNFGQEIFLDYHIYVSVDNQEYVYLGRSGSKDAHRLIWKRGKPFLAPSFQSGPQYGHQYQFRVYGIPSNDSADKKRMLTSKAPISYPDPPR